MRKAASTSSTATQPPASRTSPNRSGACRNASDIRLLSRTTVGDPLGHSRLGWPSPTSQYRVGARRSTAHDQALAELLTAHAWARPVIEAGRSTHTPRQWAVLRRTSGLPRSVCVRLEAVQQTGGWPGSPVTRKTPVRAGICILAQDCESPGGEPPPGLLRPRSRLLDDDLLVRGLDRVGDGLVGPRVRGVHPDAAGDVLRLDQRHGEGFVHRGRVLADDLA